MTQSSPLDQITRPLRQSVLADRIANFIHVTSEGKNGLDYREDTWPVSGSMGRSDSRPVLR